MIYFMQPTDGGPVKIGFTVNLSARHRQLEAHYGCDLALLATMPGRRKEEAEIHKRFDHLRFGRTEQFRPAADLMAFIGRPLLVSANHESVEALSPRPAPYVRMYEDTAKLVKRYAGERGLSVSEFVDRFMIPCAMHAHREHISEELKKIADGNG